MTKISALAALVSLVAFSATAWAVDADGDGHHSIATGGDDCDDTNPDRFPGNAEVCDLVDNDCDRDTLGQRDHDDDGFTSHECCNVQSYRYSWNGTRLIATPVYECGDDCDDYNRSLGPESQRCEAGTGRVELCGPPLPTNPGWYPVACGGAMTCAPQPNGTGVCR